MKNGHWIVTIPLAVVAFNITQKMDARNIDTLINALWVGFIILCLLVPLGIFVLSYMRKRMELDALEGRATMRDSAAARAQYDNRAAAAYDPRRLPPPNGRGGPPPIAADYEVGSFQIVQGQPMAYDDWQ